MVSITLIILGTTLIYGGTLMFDQDAIAGIGSALVGIVLIIKPVVYAIQYFMTLGGFGAIDASKSGGHAKKKSHLRIVKSSKDERPTIH